MKILGNVKILYNIKKKQKKTSAVPFSVFTISPFSLKLTLSLALNILDNEGFTVFQKSLLSETFLSSKLFWFFLTKRRNSFFLGHTVSYFLHYYY